MCGPEKVFVWNNYFTIRKHRYVLSGHPLWCCPPFYSNAFKYGSQSKIFAIVELHENSVQIRSVSLLLYQLEDWPTLDRIQMKKCKLYSFLL